MFIVIHTENRPKALKVAKGCLADMEKYVVHINGLFI